MASYTRAAEKSCCPLIVSISARLCLYLGLAPAYLCGWCRHLHGKHRLQRITITASIALEGNRAKAARAPRAKHAHTHICMKSLPRHAPQTGRRTAPVAARPASARRRHLAVAHAPLAAGCMHNGRRSRTTRRPQAAWRRLCGCTLCARAAAYRACACAVISRDIAVHIAHLSPLLPPQRARAARVSTRVRRMRVRDTSAHLKHSLLCHHHRAVATRENIGRVCGRNHARRGNIFGGAGRRRPRAWQCAPRI